MAKATIERKSHFRKKHSEIEDYSKFFNLVRKYRKFKKRKSWFYEVKTVKYNKLKTNGENTVCKTVYLSESQNDISFLASVENVEDSVKRNVV